MNLDSSLPCLRKNLGWRYVRWRDRFANEARDDGKWLNPVSSLPGSRGTLSRLVHRLFEAGIFDGISLEEGLVNPDRANPLAEHVQLTVDLHKSSSSKNLRPKGQITRAVWRPTRTDTRGRPARSEYSNTLFPATRNLPRGKAIKSKPLL